MGVTEAWRDDSIRSPNPQRRRVGWQRSQQRNQVGSPQAGQGRSAASIARRARDYDHRDYNKPLEVEPVCHSCNMKRGPGIPKQWERAELLRKLRYRVKSVRHYKPWLHEMVEQIEAMNLGFSRDELMDGIVR